jgi:hypothetical protein
MVKLCDGACPECLMTRDPSACVLQRLSAQPKPVNASFNSARNQPGLLQYLEVLRDRGLG